MINGTYGEVWVDNDYFPEVLGLEATIKLDTEEIKRTRTLRKGYKVVGITGTGTIKLNKTTSYFVKRILSDIGSGRATRATIISNLEDPEALGAERVQLNDCVFTEVKPVDWEAGKILEESIPFSFGGAELLEAIEE